MITTIISFLISSLAPALIPKLSDKSFTWLFERKINRCYQNLEDNQNIRATVKFLAEKAFKHNLKRQEIFDKLTEYLRSHYKYEESKVAKGLTGDPIFLLKVLLSLRRADENNNPFHIDLHNVDVSNTNLEGLNFRGIIFWGSNFINCNLHRANFENANLDGCDFSGASLEYSNLSGATFCWSTPLPPVRPTIMKQTKLFGAKLEKANLMGADFSGALDLNKQQLESCITNENTKLPF